MNESDTTLRAALSAIADDAPSASRVLGTAEHGYRRQVQRRRWAAAVGAAAVVVTTVAATTLFRPEAVGPSGRPAPVVTSTATAPTLSRTTVGTRAAASFVPLAAGSRLVPFAASPISSPVSVPASWVSFDADGPDVRQTSASLLVNWTGKEPTAMQTLDVRKGTTGTGQYRGYLITTAEPPVGVYAPGRDVTSTSESITVGGHAARLLTAPKGSFENDYATPAAARVVWQLPDHRWISVWAVGEDRGVLTGFAAAVSDVPTVFPAVLSPGLTVAGYTSASTDLSGFVSQMGGPMVTLCKPGTRTNADVEQCLRVFASVEDGSLAQGVVMGAESDSQFQAETSTVDVGGLRVQVNAKWQVAWTRWGAATVEVQAPAKQTLTSADLAALAASVQLAPTLGVVDQPNPIVESSLAEESAQARATSTR